MEFLPVEVLSHIFKFLTSLEDRKAASLVCKKWYNAYLCPSLRSNEVLEVRSTKFFKALTELENENRIFCHVVARSVDILESSIKFWKRYGPYIKTLSILGCDVREKFFVSLMKLCDRLESLCIQDCTELFISGLLLDDESERTELQRKLSGLRSLNLGYNRYLSDAMFVKLTSVCENIEELHLPGCHISFHPGLYHKFYSKSGHTSPSDSVFTFPVIFDFIRNHAEQLRLLSFSDTFIDSDAVSSIAQISNLSLKAIFLRRCQQLTNDGIIRLSNLQTSLTELDLTFCPRITDMSLLIVCSKLTQLTSLSIQGCRAITDLGISDIGNLTKLKRLNLSECKLIRDEGIIRGLCKRKNTNLEELYLSHLGFLSQKPIILMLEYVPNLRILDLGYCYNAVNDKTVQTISSKAKYLNSLTLTMCENLSEGGLTGLVKPSTLPLGHVSDDEYELASESKGEFAMFSNIRLTQTLEDIHGQLSLMSYFRETSLTNLKYLQQLNLSGCNCISDASLKFGLKFNDLRMLDLSYCQHVSGEGLSFFTRNNKTIENLILDNCHKVDDVGVHEILKNLKRLKKLTLGSNQITDKIVDYICEEGNSLNYLDVRHCDRLSSSAIKRMAKMTESLRRLQIFHFPDSVTNVCYNTKYKPPPPPPDPFFYFL